MTRYAGTFTVTGGRRDLHDTEPEEYLKMLIEYSGKGDRASSTWGQDTSLRKFLASHKADKLHSVKSPMRPDDARAITKDRMPSDATAEQAELSELRKTGTVPDEWSYADMATHYRSVVAGANWFAVTTYPLLSFAVSRLSVQMSKPTAAAFRAMKHLLRHMVGLKGRHLHYYAGNGEIRLTGQSDASLGDDSSSGRSQFGWTCGLDDHSAVTDWRSGKTATTIISTMGTELYALSELARTIVGWRMLLSELDVLPEGPSIIYTDSTSAMINANAYMSSSKSRAVRLRSWFIRECVDSGEIQVRWRSGKQLHVDGLTKPTLPTDYQRQMAEAHGETASQRV